MRVALLVTVAALLSSTCHPPASRPPAIDAGRLSYQPSFVYFEGCPAAAKAIVHRFGLPRDSVHQCLAQRFQLDASDTVALAHVAFGEPPDCMAGGCFYQHLCAVVEGGSVLPFAYHFASHSAPWIARGAVSSHHAPQYLTGRHHRIVRDSSFLQFYHAIIRGAWEGVPRSAWRYCTDGLPLDLSQAPQREPQN